MRGMFPAFSLIAVLASGQSAPHFDMTRVRADIDLLCTPELNGRVSLDRGANIAAAYIRAEFAKARVSPAAGGSYNQEFALVESAPLSPESRFVLVSGPQRTALQAGKDFRGNFGSDVDITAPLVFAGYGITAPEYKYDDYAGIETRGKVVVVFNHEPQEADPHSPFRGTGLTRHANIRSKLMNAAAHGAAALLLLSEPKSLHPPLSAVSLPGQPGVTRGFAPSQYDETVRIPYLTLSDAAAVKVLMPSGRTPAELQGSIDRTLKPESRDLPGASVEIRLRGEHRRGMSCNVAALLAGSDPALSAETIIINSHYDHLPNRGETHYPGANDNASGTAAMLELARAFAAFPERPRRSLLFVSFGSEEEGLLGSYYYVEHPLRPLAHLQHHEIARTLISRICNF
jgi:Peptidase family M28/PA domain